MILGDPQAVNRFLSLEKLPQLLDRAGPAAPLYVVLAGIADEQGRFEVVGADVVRALGRPKQTVSRWFGELAARGVIEPKRPGERGDPIRSKIKVRFIAKPQPAAKGGA